MLKQFVYPLANRFVLQPLGRVTRGMTLGVRAVVMDAQGGMLVVQQSYTAGWIFPGGGVERAETPLEAMARERHEEADVRPVGPVHMHGLFSNHAHYPGDYVAVYVVREYEEKHWQPSMEISARAFLPPEDIAGNCPDSMKRRLDELVGGAVPAGIW